VSEADVGEYEKQKIDAQITRILRDLGNPPPPLTLSDVRKLLKIDLTYYKSTDPSLLQELTHRFTLLARKTIPDIGKHLATALAKSKLDAFWVPASRRILLDETVPEPKHRWIESHEISHSVTDWHNDFLLGDNRFTTDPLCRATIEAEANYGAGRLLFMCDQFAGEARDMPVNFETIKKLSKRYGNSIVSTMWRLVEGRDPNQPCFGMVSNHPLFPDEIGAHDGEAPWRYFVRSAAFRIQFPGVTPADAFALVSRHCTPRKRGPVFLASDILENAIGDRWEFCIECFSTTHAVLTLATPLRKSGTVVSV
jgi:Zn-dependent peptidase ImmA (M78 family)